MAFVSQLVLTISATFEIPLSPMLMATGRKINLFPDKSYYDMQNEFTEGVNAA